MFHQIVIYREDMYMVKVIQLEIYKHTSLVK